MNSFYAKHFTVVNIWFKTIQKVSYRDKKNF